jgi:hypothetical protein
MNPKPVLNAGSDTEGAALWAWAMHDASKGAASIVTMKLIVRRPEFACIIWVAPPYLSSLRLL